MASVRGVSMREGRDPHGRACVCPHAAPAGGPGLAANDVTPLARVRALRAELAYFGLEDAELRAIDTRLVDVERSLQRSLSPAEAAVQTGEKVKTIYKALQDGRLPGRQEGPSNQWRIDGADLQIWESRPKRRPRNAR